MDWPKPECKICKGSISSSLFHRFMSSGKPSAGDGGAFIFVYCSEKCARYDEKLGLYDAYGNKLHCVREKFIKGT